MASLYHLSHDQRISQINFWRYHYISVVGMHAKFGFLSSHPLHLTPTINDRFPTPKLSYSAPPSSTPSRSLLFLKLASSPSNNRYITSKVTALSWYTSPPHACASPPWTAWTITHTLEKKLQRSSSGLSPQQIQRKILERILYYFKTLIE